MMGVWALIPIKGKRQAKTRLSCNMTERQRVTFRYAMVEDLLDGLSQSRLLNGVALYGPDDETEALAARRGVAFLRQTNHVDGLNQALRDGTRRLANAGADIIAVLPGDLPVLRGTDLDLPLAATSDTGRRSIVANRQGDGTNCLVFKTSTPPVFAFGSRSFQRHLAQGSDGQRPSVWDLHSIALDIDTPQDINHLCALSPDVGGRRTFRLARAYGFDQRPIRPKEMTK